MRKYLGRTSDNRDAMSYTVEKGDLSLTLEGKSYLGGVIGKCAGINNDAKITVDGVDHLLTHNYGEVHFHGESKGFDKQIFNVDILCCHIVLFYKKYPFMQNGYFGTRNRNRTCNYPLGEQSSHFSFALFVLSRHAKPLILLDFLANIV